MLGEVRNHAQGAAPIHRINSSHVAAPYQAALQSQPGENGEQIKPFYGSVSKSRVLSYRVAAIAQIARADLLYYFGFRSCILFLDLRLTDGNPLPKLPALKQQTPRKFVTIVISESSEVKQIREAYQAGADTILIKPVNPAELINFLTFRGFRLELE